MSNLGANGINKTFKTGVQPKAPYIYVQATLDLSGKPYGTYYFNADNNFSYGEQSEYRNFIQIDENSIISEILVYTNPDVEFVDPLVQEDVEFTIGGAANTSTSPVIVPWVAPAGEAPVAPPGFVGGPLSAEQLNAGPVNYFGHEGGHFPYYENLESKEDLSNAYKWLAITISNPNVLLLDERQAFRKLTRYERQMRQRARSLPVGPSVIQQGVVTVVLKLYPKQQ